MASKWKDNSYISSSPRGEADATAPAKVEEKPAEKKAGWSKGLVVILVVFNVVLLVAWIVLLKVLKLQHVEVQQLIADTTVSMPAAKRGDKPTSGTIPAGSYVIRLDQPYSRVADALLDKQYWAPDDPQKHPYDDTGWS